VTRQKTTPGKGTANTAPPATPLGFSEDSLKFLRGLKRNNNREWFEPRKPHFETVLKAPMLRLVEEVTAAMTDFAPGHIRPAQRSIMRIYRDTRFSNDKTPYKNQIAAWWSRQGLEKTSGGGFYLHLSGEELVIAAGVYMPEREQLKAIRTFLLEHHAELRSLLADRKLLRLFSPDHGGVLSRPPKGFPKEHAALDLIQCRQWAVFAKLSSREALGPGLAKKVVRYFRTAAPLVELLNRPLTAAPERKPQPLFGLY
jgi:uncharacterized protein (TIGR02453 family)